MRKKFIYVLWALVVGILLVIAFIFTAIAKGWIGYVPPIEELENPNLKFATEIISDDGKMLGTWSLSKENRVFVGYDQLSPNLIHALIATEDERFAEHSGIDARAFIRALVKRGVMMQKNAGGGSTITQQLAKQFYSPTADNVMERLLQKPIEWVIAVQLERYYTKEEILTMYLNKFDFLNNAVGIKTAANTYFSKEPKDLNIEEAATLVGMCKNPSLYNPKRFNERSRGRRNVVLDQMRKAGYLTDAEADSLKALPLVSSFLCIPLTSFPITHHTTPRLEYPATLQKVRKKSYTEVHTFLILAVIHLHGTIGFQAMGLFLPLDPGLQLGVDLRIQFHPPLLTACGYGLSKLQNEAADRDGDRYRLLLLFALQYQDSGTENGVFNIPEFFVVLQRDIWFWFVIVNRQLFTVGLIPLCIQFGDPLVFGESGNDGVNRLLHISGEISIHFSTGIVSQLIDQLGIQLLHLFRSILQCFHTFQQFIDPPFRFCTNLIPHLCFQCKIMVHFVAKDIVGEQRAHFFNSFVGEIPLLHVFGIHHQVNMRVMGCVMEGRIPFHL